MFLNAFRKSCYKAVITGSAGKVYGMISVMTCQIFCSGEICLCICPSSKLTVFLELYSVGILEQIMFADKYPCNFCIK